MTGLRLYEVLGKVNGEYVRRAEYRHLEGLGYAFYEAQTWTYRGKGEKVYYTIVVGAFTEEQLANSPVNPEYGYMFRFVYNGDHSSLDGDQLVTAFETNYACRIPPCFGPRHAAQNFFACPIDKQGTAR